MLEVSRRTVVEPEVLSSIVGYLGAPQETLTGLVLKPSLVRSLTAGRYHVDKLQQIHAAYNFYEILSLGTPGAPAVPPKEIHAQEQLPQAEVHQPGQKNPAEADGVATYNAALIFAKSPPRHLPCSASTAEAQSGASDSPSALRRGRGQCEDVKGAFPTVLVDPSAAPELALSLAEAEEAVAALAAAPAGTASAAAPAGATAGAPAAATAAAPAAAAAAAPAAATAAAPAAAAATAAWDLFQRLKKDYVSKAVGELTRAREAFWVRFLETEKYRTERTLLCAGRKRPPKRFSAGISFSPCDATADPAGDPAAPRDSTRGPSPSNVDAAHEDAQKTLAEAGGAPGAPGACERPRSAIEELSNADAWRKPLGGGRWFTVFTALDYERSRAVAFKCVSRLMSKSCMQVI